MEQLYEYFTRKLKETSTDFLRYKYPFIKWDVKAFGLVGPRGVWKIHNVAATYKTAS